MYKLNIRTKLMGKRGLREYGFFLRVPMEKEKYQLCEKTIVINFLKLMKEISSHITKVGKS